ncbi:FecR family protein [Chryseosolibacter indicus]|uniref:FecR domain-containing protein n=1 Tax=Chryseosolibacter indicus TaxID=2782351 RepID=A0ABS5VT72_9BACT|nr:FecR domain-containing protein [Chryseosolibacter indicus]MBT1704612.1 FecR domain-containing protein [Chryseosolibacter indicus]
MKEIPFDLIARYLSNQASDLEQDQLLDWVSQDILHQKIFHEFKEAWESQHVREDKYNAHLALKAVNEKIDAQNSNVHTLRIPLFKVAATITLLIACSITIRFIFKATPPSETMVTAITTTKTDTIYLEDGSRVILNKNSSLSYPKKFNSKVREVKLNGEAFFEVAHNSAKPFKVIGKHVTTQVLGTSFNIHTTKQYSTVTVISGRVKVFNDQREAILNIADQIKADSSNTFLITRIDTDEVTGWIDNSFSFKDSPLDIVVTQIANRFDLENNVDPESIKDCVITARFRNESLEDILKAISFSTGTQFQVHNKTINLLKGCE